MQVTVWQCCWCWICQRSAGVCRWCGAETLQAVTEEDEMDNGYRLPVQLSVRFL
jgi:hypothetical protein